MKLFLGFVLVLMVSINTTAQLPITTVILIRHAEKMSDGSKDPDLTDAGIRRTESLVKLLAQLKVDAIYSTNFKRTQNTVMPLATSHSLPVLTYDASKVEELDGIVAKYPGGTIVICGHSNTTPSMVNYLTGHKDEYKTFDDSDYSNLVIVSFIQIGKEAKITWLKY